MGDDRRRRCEDSTRLKSHVYFVDAVIVVVLLLIADFRYAMRSSCCCFCCCSCHCFEHECVCVSMDTFFSLNIHNILNCAWTDASHMLSDLCKDRKTLGASEATRPSVRHGDTMFHFFFIALLFLLPLNELESGGAGKARRSFWRPCHEYTT